MMMSKRKELSMTMFFTPGAPGCVLLITFLTFLHFRTDAAVTMLTESQFYVLNAGETATLDCCFQATTYNMFDYPLLWRKVQRGEDSQVNIMGNVNQPFLGSGRYDVTFNQSAPIFKLQLQITDVIQEDSGNYTCEVRGPQSVVLACITHLVLVRASIESLLIKTGSRAARSYRSSTVEPSPPLPVNGNHNNSSNHVVPLGHVTSQTVHVTSQVLHAVEDKKTSLWCSAVGGYPLPELDITVGQRHDYSGQLHVTTTVNVTGSKGLRLMRYTTERWTDSFMPSAADHAATVQCTASVPGLKARTAFAKLDVTFAPKVTCYSTFATPTEMNVNVRCEIRSNPSVSAIFWILDANGTTLAEGEVIDETWTLVMERTDHVVEALLYLRRLDETSFRKYTIVVENSVAIATKDVELIQSQGLNRFDTKSSPSRDRSVSDGRGAVSADQEEDWTLWDGMEITEDGGKKGSPYPAAPFVQNFAQPFSEPGTKLTHGIRLCAGALAVILSVPNDWWQ